MRHLSVCALALFLSLTACTKKEAPIGSEDNPIKFFFVPSVDAKVLSEKAELVKAFLEKETPYKYKIGIPTSYVAVVESFGTGRADVASLNTFGYILANEKYGVEAKLTVVRFGSDTYQAQIIAKADGPINELKDINGKKVAYVDPTSTSGYLLPAKLFKDNHIEPKETMFAQKHDNVVTMVYQGQVDAGATFYTPPQEGKIEDARRLVLTQYPDVEKKVKIVKLTDPIPNDPFVFRKDLPEDVKEKIIEGLLKFLQTPEGKEAFHSMYGITELRRSTDATYDSVRLMLQSLGKSANDLMKK